MNYFKYTTITLAFFSSVIFAHGDDNWCANGQVKSMAQITVTPQELNDNLLNGVNCGIPPENPLDFPKFSPARKILNLIEPVLITRNHGEDDNANFNNINNMILMRDMQVNAQQSYINDYYKLAAISNVEYASALAYSHCVCATMAGCPKINPDESQPSFQTAEMNDANHHNIYKFADGLVFSCQVCQRSLTGQ